MNAALLLFAGSSTRFHQKTPKQFYLINGEPLFSYPLMKLEKSKDIDAIILITNKDKVVDVYNYVKNKKIRKVKAVLAGGNSRNESVKIGLDKLSEFLKDDDIVLIHDAARLLLDEETIKVAINETKKYDATTFAIHMHDTLVKADSHFVIKEYINRDEVFAVQTPQTFKFKIINEAYKVNKRTNDDTELVHLTNKRVHLLKGSDKLFKVTNADDIKKIANYLKCDIK